jgi:hypothetical protein
MGIDASFWDSPLVGGNVMKKHGFTYVLSAFLFFASFAIGLGAGSAWAKDAVMASITEAPDAIGIDENGNPYSPGTYAIGTIKLHYSNIATSWEPGEFSNFTLHIEVKQGKPKPPTTYPVALHFRDVGAGLNLAVTGCDNMINSSFADSTLTLGGPDAEADCNVRVTIPDVDDSLDFDGALLVGNLQMETEARAHLDTVTTVQVRVMLVFPDEEACLRLYNVITNNGVTQVVENLQINPKSNPPSQVGDIQNTTPNNIADVVYVVNTCQDPYTVDIGIALESHFKADPAPPGNSVAYFSSDTFDPDSESLTDVWEDEFDKLGSPDQGAASLCLDSKTIAGGTTYLIKAGIKLIPTNVSDLPGYTDPLTDFDNTFSSFTSGVFDDASNCSDASADSDPNNITLDLDFSVIY